MADIKAHQAKAFLKSIKPEIRGLLFYGPDTGLASERARAAGEQIAARGAEPGDIVRIDENDLAEDPDRLVIELQTVPMFGGEKIVRAPVTAKVQAKALEELFAEGGPAGFLILEGGDLKPANAIRKLFAKQAGAAAVACFPDGQRDLGEVIDEVLGAAALRIGRDARAHLASMLGADRALSRGEVEKLALYAAGKEEVGIDDVDAVVGDASELAFDRVALAATGGEVSVASREFDRLATSGQTPQSIVLAIQRHLIRLSRVKALLDAGKAQDAALAGARPPVHFKQKEAFAKQARSWRVDRLNEALTRCQDAIARTRRTPQLERQIAERLLLELAALSGRRLG